MPRTAKKDPNLQPGKPVKSANLSTRAAIEWDRLTSELENATSRLPRPTAPCCRSRPRLRQTSRTLGM
jgi:hypothetical protein